MTISFIVHRQNRETGLMNSFARFNNNKALDNTTFRSNDIH